MNKRAYVIGYDSQFVVLLLVFAFCIGVGVYVFSSMSPQLMNDICSLNGTVTDTYYDAEIGKCVLTQCLKLPFVNKSGCYYPPPNITALSSYQYDLEVMPPDECWVMAPFIIGFIAILIGIVVTYHALK